MMMKEQVHKILQPSLSEHLPKETNYALDYIYGSPKPHAVTDAGDKLYSYDPAGNMTGWEHKQNGTRRTIIWNEENRVKEIDDNGSATYFLYDDSGERVVKRGQHGESVYVNRFYAVRNGELGTKHVFAGETRVLSKLVKTPPTVDINPTTDTDFPGSKGILNALGRGKGNKFGIFKRLDREGVPLSGTLPVEKDQFYYHGDHLGSSNMITDIAGSVYQHLEYFPYGETWIEEGGSYGGNTPGYKFTGKELDPETGLYYYGARYYEPVLSRWISADPAFIEYLPKEDLKERSAKDRNPDKYLPGQGGIYKLANLNLLGYAANNPLKFIDPDGKKIRFAPGSSSAFQKQWGDIITYLNKGKVSGTIAELEKRPETVYVKEATKQHDFYYDPNTNEIVFDPTSGLEVSPGNVQTPALGVLHEASHALQELKNPTQQAADVATPDPNYGNLEEKRVIDKVETPAAVKIGEPTRAHHGGTPVTVSCPTCDK